MITEPAAFFTDGCGRCNRFGTDACSARLWRDGLAALRRICRAAGLEEAVRWGHPCYRHAGRNIAIIGAFRDDFRLSFFDAALLRDPQGVLEKQGPMTQHADMIRFADAGRVAALEGVILAYLREAMDHAEAGRRPEKTEKPLDLPPELVSALDSDAELAEAFHRLTPGRQRSYVINLSGAKATATRQARIARFRSHILAGKGATER
ncbi:YdeI/OmpD-associated family protein [Pseudotabrizicola algicola]|uniref:YdhG-like domain-containing protein n=1 Tax=Pseudotabrizicola algicola TaxID=2709381 RepID=A0A6B3RLR8_9RHOB|nr:hypothetical protein [Pseudotabrizicola algicola]